jgi:hypothetical protein
MANADLCISVVVVVEICFPHAVRPFEDAARDDHNIALVATMSE